MRSLGANRCFLHPLSGWLLFCVLACGVPPLNVEGKSCSLEDPCPEPWQCSPQGTCQREATGSGNDDVLTVVAAGRIACAPSAPDFNQGNGTATSCRMSATAALAASLSPDVVLPLGDAQYTAGTLDEYTRSYDLSWGAFSSIARPVPGTHDYFTGGALGYFNYFGDNAGSPSKGYYSFDLGAWHFVALNTQCGEVAGGCGVGSPQETWLREDLAAHPSQCVLAYGSTPRFSSGERDEGWAPLWNALHEYGVELLLHGGGRHYERLAPSNPSGAADEEGGIRQFIVGTGGIGGFGNIAPRSPLSERAQVDTFGVLELKLSPNRYSFRFHAVAPDPFKDEGSGVCH